MNFNDFIHNRLCLLLLLWLLQLVSAVPNMKFISVIWRSGKMYTHWQNILSGTDVVLAAVVGPDALGIISDGPGQFRCPYCERRFNSPSNARRHLRLHNPRAEPFRCPLCSRSYGRKDTMKAHLKICRLRIVAEGGLLPPNGNTLWFY